MLGPIVRLDGEQAEMFRDQFIYGVTGTADPMHRLRVAIEFGQVKFKVNERVWSRPFGMIDPSSDAAVYVLSAEEKEIIDNLRAIRNAQTGE